MTTYLVCVAVGTVIGTAVYKALPESVQNGIETTKVQLRNKWNDLLSS